MVVSKYVHHVRSETIRVDKPHAAQAEVSAIIDVGIAMRALISSCEYFTRLAKLKPQKWWNKVVHVHVVVIVLSISLLFFPFTWYRSMALPRQIENEKANPKSVTSNHSPLGGTSYYDDREDSHIRWVQNMYSYDCFSLSVSRIAFISISVHFDSTPSIGLASIAGVYHLLEWMRVVNFTWIGQRIITG